MDKNNIIVVLYLPACTTNAVTMVIQQTHRGLTDRPLIIVYTHVSPKVRGFLLVSIVIILYILYIFGKQTRGRCCVFNNEVC